MSERVCKGCGEPLPPKTWQGRDQVWCSDRCRKAQYDLTCVKCGGRVSGTDPGKMANRDEPVCIRCAAGFYAVWTAEAIVCAIQEWADDHGGIPPSSNDFRRLHQRDVSAVPNVNHVRFRFETWNAAIRAAGFEPHSGGCRREFRPKVKAEAIRRYEAGESSVAIAADLDCSPATVTGWARAAGVPIRAGIARRAA
jgi:hypothetical protein